MGNLLYARSVLQFLPRHLQLGALEGVSWTFGLSELCSQLFEVYSLVCLCTLCTRVKCTCDYLGDQNPEQLRILWMLNTVNKRGMNILGLFAAIFLLAT